MSFAWKGGARAAVSLTFDDGLPSHLHKVIPLLNRFGVSATFYLIPGGLVNWQDSVRTFSGALAQGHEIGNHTMSHWCGAGVRDEPDRSGLEYRTLEEMEIELEESDRRLRTVYPEVKRWSFAYPCYRTDLGRGVNRQSFVPLVAERFTAARAGAERPETVNSPHHSDLHALSAWDCAGRSGSEMVGLVEHTLEENGYGIFVFHGIGEGYSPVGEDDFATLVRHLVRRRGALWVDTVISVAAYLEAYRLSGRTG
jgi:hypothetical protein